MRTVSLSSAESFFDVLEKICKTMGRANNQVIMGYEAPWSAKINSKKCVAYISNEEELREFWSSYAGCVESKKKGKGVVSITGIVFVNMSNNTQVRRYWEGECCVLIFYRMRQRRGAVQRS